MDKTFDAASAEPRLYEAWEQAGAFRAGAGKRRDETFSILLPPPNVTGTLHVGHAFNHTLMDVLVRWHRMRGFDTLWQPGLDHAGIATQMVVERELAREGLDRREMTRDEFVAKVWEWKARSGGAIVEQDERLGASMDWSREVFTMDPAYQEAVLKTFVDLYERRIIYRGKRLVNWDPHFETAISDLEVENVETQGHFWHFRYPLEGGETYEYVERDADGHVTLRETRDYISIATTRPETMLGDGAVAVHPSDERYAPIVGKRVLLPLAERYIPIIADEHPDPALGSGAVKITGAHDFNDYAVAQRHDIPLFVLMDTKARMRGDDAPDNPVPEAYRGLDRFEARKAIVADLDARGLLDRVEDRLIMQPMGDRSKVVIEPMLTDQWFVDAERLAGPAVEAVRQGMARAEGSTEGTKILPEGEAKVYFNWLENIEPWCISRQLWWGHRIPVWYDPDGNEFCALTQDAAAEKVRERHGHDVTVRFRDALPEGLEAGARARALPSASIGGFVDESGQFASRTVRSVTLSRDPDVLDTWFSSALWPFATMGWPEETPELRRYFPSDVLVTGFDILFFWVARMMMMSQELTGERPFHTVYVHALVRDEAGQKMSKSKGNVIDPLDLVDRYGADAVRFTLASMASMGRDLRLSDNRVAGYRNFATKLWNASRFAKLNEARFGGERPEPRLTVNRWILGETGRVREAVDAALSAYRFDAAAQTLYAFVWGRVCDWYVELAKPLLDAGGEGAEETRATMGWVIDQCLLLLHPCMPFVTEALWGELAERSGMLALAPWPEYGAEIASPEADRETEWVIGLIEAVRSVRGEMGVPAGAKVPMLEVELGQAERGFFERNASLIQRLARIERVERAVTAPKGAVTVAVPGGLYALPLADVIDVAAERQRLEKSLGKLDKELGGLRGRLGNPKFVESAPETVVAETRANLAAREAEEAKLRAALARLTEVA